MGRVEIVSLTVFGKFQHGTFVSKLRPLGYKQRPVIMNKTDKIHEAEVQLEKREHYQPLEAPMVKTTQQEVNNIIDELHRGKHIDDMTRKRLSQTSSPPRIPIFYTLTKIHKPKPVGRPIIGNLR